MRGFNTRAIHGVSPKPDVHGSLRPPVYDSAAFEFASSADLQKAFEGRLNAHAYSRITNPTVEEFEQRLRLLSGAQGVVATASGMAAISTVFMTLARSGSNIVTSRYLFGNTFSLLSRTLAPWGLATRSVDMCDLGAVDAAIDKNTACVFLESVTNPQLEVADIAALVTIGTAKKVPVVVDNTALTPYLFNTRDAGVAVEVISTTKYVTGGATSIGGAILDNGVFDWSSNPRLIEAVKKTGPHAFLSVLRREVHRNMGACMAPHNAYLQTLGLESMGLRIDRSCENALRIAEFLSTRRDVLSVNYPGLVSSAGHAVAAKQFGTRFGGLLTFELEDKTACFRFMDRLQVVRRATNINDNKSLVIHPASTIFCEYSGTELAAMGVNDRMIRFSTGIEDINDLIHDIEQGLAQS